MTNEERELHEEGIAEILDAEPESEEDRLKAELDEALSEESIHPTAQVGERAFALVIEKDDMVPLLNPGEYIIVDPDQKPEQSGDIAVVSILDNRVDLERGVVTDVRETLLREVIFEDDGTVYLTPTRRAPDIVLCPHHSLDEAVIGKVVEKQEVPLTGLQIIRDLEALALAAEAVEN